VRNVNNGMYHRARAILANPYVKYTVRSAMSKQYSVQCSKACFSGGELPETESCKTTQSHYSYRFGYPASAKSVIWEFEKRFRQAENVNIPKRVGQSTVTETRIAKVSDRLACKSAQVIAETWATNWNVVQ
jgi:hypothetical protein